MAERGNRKDKNQNIQVFVRLRPLNQRERDIKSLGVVEVVNGREIVVRQQQTTLAKKFTFDRAFAPNTKQVEVYHEVVSPLIEEVLAGYNCTVFAYGQTGTGKTHTMVGEHTGDQTTWQNDPLAGIIPRALSQLFDELRLSNTEYTVRVSYLELYNEELFDLLSSSEDNSKLRIYEDVTRKGSNIVNGLEEITVYNKNEVYKIMAQGQERKRVASTLMNAQSSRSHTVFTIVVHMKENSPEGEELVKIGKLNLVDLAGSENISKAGSDNPAKKERARECVNINQSLLTLGRVITALVERHPHIPYRESKLTRILQESLGGRTKTSIIATISPGHKDLEETLSTLEYAHRAKNIQNKPEINQKMTKKAILKEYAEEIDRLKRDLQATRDKNGVYLASETYAEITLKSEEQNKEIQNLILQKRAMEEARDKMEGVFNDISSTLKSREKQLDKTRRNLDVTRQELGATKNKLDMVSQECDEQKHLVTKHAETEVTLTTQAGTLLQTADLVTHHVNSLHDNVDKRRTIESSNLELTRSYREMSQQLRDTVATHAHHHLQNLDHHLHMLATREDEHNTFSVQNQRHNMNIVNELNENRNSMYEEIKTRAAQNEKLMGEKTSAMKQTFEGELEGNCAKAEHQLRSFVASLSRCLGDAKDIDNRARDSMQKFVQQWYISECGRVASLGGVQAQFVSEMRRGVDERTKMATNYTDQHRRLSNTRANTLAAYVEQVELESHHQKSKLHERLQDLNKQRQDASDRLKAWMEEEKKLFEERLLKHVTEELNTLDERQAQQKKMIDEEVRDLEENIKKCREWRESQMEEVQQSLELASVLATEYESDASRSKQCLGKFEKEFSEETSVLSTDMEAFSRNVMELVEHNHGEILRGMDHAQRNVEKEISEAIVSNRECSSKLKETSDGLFDTVVRVAKEDACSALSLVQTYNAHLSEKLAAVQQSISSGVTAEESHHTTCRDIVSAARLHMQEYGQVLRTDVTHHADIEEKYLERDYRIYSPSGSTPCRQQYMYPRSLAATSPHLRILSRYRAARREKVNTCDEEDCVVVESEEYATPQSSDCDSSSPDVMENEREMFVAPATKLSVMTNGHTLMKSTSESDIYAFKKNQGKENHQHSSSSKKPSKLPAPSSLKKPLVDRNTSVN